ncbi:MAG: talC [Nitrospira sp.]|nr:talC [Nitrospira sp.]
MLALGKSLPGWTKETGTGVRRSLGHNPGKGIDMNIYLDTANVKDIKDAMSDGAVDGITTNPSLAAKEGRDFKELVLEICHLVDGPISAEVINIEADAIVKEGRELAQLHPNVVVKCPLIPEGLKATKRLAAEGIRVNVTLCFSPTQALLAAKAGAWCVSPFIGRLDDVGADGMDLIRQIITIYHNYNFATEVLVASVRHPVHVVEAALAGGDSCTMPYNVYQQLIRHPLTDIGLKRFLADWNAQRHT